MSARRACSLAVLAATLVTTSAQAALIGRLPDAFGVHQAVYDTDLDITWLADANYAATSGHSGDGRMKWAAAQDWIDTLNVAGLLGFNDWRLPNSDGCIGYNCSGSELGHLFYIEFGGMAGYGAPVPALDHPNLSLFANVQTAGTYWSGTEYLADAPWTFEFGPYDAGRQIYYPEFYKFHAWAVRDGDVVAAAPMAVMEAMAVPLPATAWLFGGGLGALMVLSRKRAD